MATTEFKSTVSGAASVLTPRLADRGVSNTQRALRRLRKHRMALFGLALLVFIFLYVLIGSLLIPESRANFNDPAQAYQFPSNVHIYGTDEIGRDIFARTIYGGQISLFVGVAAVVVQLMIGVSIGLLAGFLGKTVDAILMRITETLLAIPTIFIALLVVKVVSDPQRLRSMGISSTFTFAGRDFHITFILMIIVIGTTSWMRIARIVRAQVLSIKEQEYITAARSIGAPTWRIILQHILPNCMGPIIVSATLGVGGAILLEAYLGFLGMGVKPPTATWGNLMEAAARTPKNWFYWFFPAGLIMLTTLGINFFGDGLRDALDPRSTK